MKRFSFRYQRILKLKKQYHGIADLKAKQSGQQLASQSVRIRHLGEHLVSVTAGLMDADNPTAEKRHMIGQIALIKNQLQLERERHVEIASTHKKNCEYLKKLEQGIDVLSSLKRRELAKYRSVMNRQKLMQIDEFIQFKDSVRRRSSKSEGDHV